MTGTDRLRPRVVCANCLHKNLQCRPFCRRCNAPLTAYAVTGPIEQVVTTGYAYRRSTDTHIPGIVVIGWWVVMGLPLLVTVGIAAATVNPGWLGALGTSSPNVGDSIVVGSGPAGGGFTPIRLDPIIQGLGMALCAVVLIAQIVFLAKLTWRYTHQPAYDWSEPPPDNAQAS